MVGEDEVRDVKDFEGGFVVFDDILHNNEKLIGQFFARRTQKCLNVVFYLAKLYFDVLKITIRDNKNTTIILD